MKIWRCDLTPQYEHYRPRVLDAMDRVMQSGIYILGREVASFERSFAAYVGMAHGVGVANATDGLTLGLMALGVGPGDEVITTPYTAIPSVSAIVDAGATPVFVDIDPETYLVDLGQMVAAITPRTRALMPVHIFGNVVDVDRLRAMAPGVPILEDAAQAHGATLRGRQAGSFGDVSVFSFYPTKNLGAYGDGGLVATNDAALDERMRRMRMYGMVNKDHIVIDGFNTRLDELQAAVLSLKLPDLDAMNARRRAVAQAYRTRLRPDLFRHQHVPQGVESNFHVFVSELLGDRDGFVRWMDRHEIQTNVYYVVPLHLQPPHRRLGYQPGSLPVAESLCTRAIALPMYAELTDAQVDEIIDVANAFGRA